jgi:hypothetical protein
MKFIGVALLALASMSATQAKQTFTGVITDEMCAGVGHSPMQMGPTDAESTRASVNLHGTSYVLFDGKKAYTLSDQDAGDRFAAQNVRIIGVLNAKTNTIEMESIAATK